MVTELTAEAIVALGGSQASLWGTEECRELAQIADALVVSVGSPTDRWFKAASEATLVARERDVSWILDPVAYGVLPFRTRVIDALLQNQPTVIKGNAFEIMSLAGADASGKGADSLTSVEDAEPAARALAHRHGCVVAVTGSTDIVTDGEKIFHLTNGHEMMTAHTGTGCMAGAAIGCLLAVNADPLEATVAALAFFAVAGETAAEKSSGPGSLRMHLIDLLYALDEQTFCDRLRYHSL